MQQMVPPSLLETGVVEYLQAYKVTDSR